MDHVIGGKFKLGRKIGSGSFGELFIGMLFFFCLVGFEQINCDFLFAAFYYVVLLLLINMFLLFFLMLAVNVQTGEEVAIKLVC